MGIDANLLVSSKNGVAEIRKLLENGLGFKVTSAEYREDHAFLRIVNPANNETRQIFISRSNYAGFECTYLSLRSDDFSIGLFTRIAKVLGGFLCEQDCHDTCTVFQNPHDGNARFILDHQILTNAITDGDSLSNAVADATGYDRPKVSGIDKLLTFGTTKGGANEK